MRKVLLVLFVFLFLGTFSLKAQDTILRTYCTEVNPDGSTTIYFDTLSLPDFTEYVISAFNLDSNAYIRIGSITDIAQGTYTDNSHNANLSQIKYLITGDFGSIARPFSYINTMYLQTTLVSDNVYRLNWTSIGSKAVGSEGQKYRIFRRFAKEGSWELIDSTTDLTYIDNIPPVCSDTLSYKIELPNIYGCRSVSNIKSSLVGDTEIPNEPVLLSSSVDIISQKLTLSWTPSTSSDTWGYIVCAGNPCVAIDTIWGSQSDTYTCPTCNVEQVSSLAIFAFDSCFNSSLKTNPHKNIVLSFSRQACSPKINLSWTPYQALPVNVENYKLYMSQNGSDFSLHQTFSPSEYSFEFTANPTIETYCFYIEAVLSNNQIANSNKICSSEPIPKQVEFAYIRYASVSSDNKQVELGLYVDASLKVSSYNLYRAKGDGDFNLIKKISYTGNNSLTYIDTPPTLLSKNVYRYKLEVPDECDLLFKTSNIVSTIKLNVDASDADKNLLTWNDVLGWVIVGEYQVYRTEESSPEGFQIGSVTSASLGFEESTMSMLSTADKISYYLIAKEGGVGVAGQNAQARSSTAEVTKESLIFIPNAFTPTDIANNEFKPSCLFIKRETYNMKIFTRWGEKIFETSSVEKGWDGTFKGKLCAPASYVYVIEFMDSEGEKIKKAGTVNLID